MNRHSRSPKQREFIFAYISLLLAVAIFACTPIIVRVSEGTMSPTATIFNRAWIAALMVGIWKLRGRLNFWQRGDTSIRLDISPDQALLLLGLISTSLTCQFFWAWSLTKTTVANSEVLHSFTPVFTTLIGFLFLKRSFDHVFLRGISITVLGSILLVGIDFSASPERVQGDSLALASAFFWALALIVTKKLQSQIRPVEIVGWTSFGSAILMSPFILFGSSISLIFPHTLQDWLIEILLSSLLISSQIFLINSLKVFPPGFVSTVLLLNPVLTALLAYFIFSEPLSLLNCLAMLIIISGIYLTSKGKVSARSKNR